MYIFVFMLHSIWNDTHYCLRIILCYAVAQCANKILYHIQYHIIWFIWHSSKIPSQTAPLSVRVMQWDCIACHANKQPHTLHTVARRVHVCRVCMRSCDMISYIPGIHDSCHANKQPHHTLHGCHANAVSEVVLGENIAHKKFFPLWIICVAWYCCLQTTFIF